MCGEDDSVCVCGGGGYDSVWGGGHGYDSVCGCGGEGGDYKLTLWTAEESNAPELTSCSCNE